MDVKSFNPDTDIADCSGKVFLVTGGTAGLGKITVINLVKHNAARVYFTGRKRDAARQVIDEAKDANPKTQVRFLEADFTSLASVRRAAAHFDSDSDRLDALICNAGVMAIDPGLTQDGYEVQFGINYLAHAMLVRELLPVLKRTRGKAGSPARVILLSSLGYQFPPSAGISFDDLRTLQDWGFFASWLRYGQSKLAALLFAAELARRHPPEELLAVSVHPGIIATDLVDSLSLGRRMFVYATTVGRRITPAQGALNSTYLAAVDPAKIESGQFYEPIARPGPLTKLAKDEALAARLWDWTQAELDAFAAKA